MTIFRFSQTILFFCLFIISFINLPVDASEADIASSDSAIKGESVRIEVDLGQQLVRVFSKDARIKEMPCSSGKADTPTPEGSFETYEKVENSQWTEPDGNVISFYYFTRFNGGLGFHSKIVGNSPFVEEGERKFENREPSSMGCVRLLLSDAKWLYDEIGLGAKVEVH